MTAATGLPSAELEDTLRSIDLRELEHHGDPFRALSTLGAERLGQRLGGFTHARYFHGTRTADPESFCQHGLLPLSQALERIWSDLRAVSGGIVPPSAFDSLRGAIENGGGGDGGRQYRLKTSDRFHHGPFGEFVREHLLHPESLSNHDYLRTPELVEDIALAARELLGVCLLGAYRRSTRPYIVAFDLPLSDEADAVAAACWYLRATATGQLTRFACGGFDGTGISVPATAIREVELIN